MLVPQYPKMALCAQNAKYLNKFNILTENYRLVVVEGSLEAFL